MESWLRASRDLLETALGDRPIVLMDVGAAGSPPEVWLAIAPISIYVGFDPDLRDLHEDDSTRFKRFVMVDKAITDEPRTDVTFHLTASPHCSSVLAPDPARVGRYSFADEFEVDRTVTVAATDFAAALAEVGLEGIDWLKLDSQGKDLDLFTSLPEAVSSRMGALDAEPGMEAFYLGENTFEQLHAHPALDGFWLSRLDLQHNTRIGDRARRSLANDVEVDALPGSPTAAEARYLRTPEHLRATGAGVREYACLWAFSMADDRPGAALDVALALGELDTALGSELEQVTLSAIHAAQRRRARSVNGIAKRVLPRSLHSVAKKIRDA